MRTYEVLEKALARFQRVGHWRAGVPMTAGGTCPLLAIGFVVAESLEASQERTDAQLALASVLGGGIGVIPDFSDTHKQGEVEDLFRAAIRAEKAKAGVSLDPPSPQPDEKTEDREAVKV